MRPFDICVLSRFPEIFEGFRKSVDQDAPEARKIIIWDQDAQGFTDPPHPWWSLQAKWPFKIARNASAMFAGEFSQDTEFGDYRHDLIYAGDDTRIIERNTCERLRAAAYGQQDIGILAARIGQRQPQLGRYTLTGYAAFVFVYIKREVIDTIGYLDERFEGYGVEDYEYCFRAVRAGFKVGFANDVAIQHGISGRPTETFRRVKPEQQIWSEDAANWKRFEEKYGITKAEALKEVF